jgi:F0F1-type ATP synthase membrane subunit b/b'
MSRSIRDRQAGWPRLLLVLAPALLASALLLSPLAAQASPAAHGDAGIEWVTPIFGHSGKLGLLWSLINFAVLFWILERILWKPLRVRTRNKHDAVKSEIDKATTAREEAQGVLAEYKGRLARLDQEIEALLADAKAKAETDRARILEAARREAEQITATALATAEREAAARRRQLEAEIIDRAIARAETLLRQRMTAADQRTMADRYVEQLAAVDFGGRPS